MQIIENRVSRNVEIEVRAREIARYRLALKDDVILVRQPDKGSR